MAGKITIYDETTAGEKRAALAIEILTERITVQELIRSRVYQEVKDYNLRQADVFQGLVQPTDTERTINGYKMKVRRKINWQEQVERAIAAFQTNGFIILVNDRQVEDLEEAMELKPETSVSFLKLIPLVGG